MEIDKACSVRDRLSLFHCEMHLEWRLLVAKMIINVNQQLDQCGNEFLDETDFNMEVNLDPGNLDYVSFTFGKYEDCFIKRDDLAKLCLALGL